MSGGSIPWRCMSIKLAEARECKQVEEPDAGIVAVLLLHQTSESLQTAPLVVFCFVDIRLLDV